LYIKDEEGVFWKGCAGKAEGLALLLRATPVHSAKRRTYIPIDIAAKVGILGHQRYFEHQ
jgi:hypothetical protein